VDDPAILEERIARNRHAREVIAGLDVTPGMHEQPPGLPTRGYSPGAMPTLRDPSSVYVLCVLALLVAGAIVAILAGGLAASIVFFIASLALLAGFFVF